ncbi:MAG: ion channel [Alphaproteobacteria bacterium]
MFTQILIGSILITATVAIEVVFIQAAIRVIKQHGTKYIESQNTVHQFIILSSTTLWLLAALSLSIWIWALAFWGLGAFPELEHALYFSMVSFTTLGFGDLTLPLDWRLLSGIIAANGLIMFGLNTAFLIEILGRMLLSSDDK